MKFMKRFSKVLFLSASLVLSGSAFAQTNDGDWDSATRYWNHQKYNAAQHHYDVWLAENPDAAATQVALAQNRSTS